MNNLELKIKRLTIAAEARGIRINQNRLRRRIRRLHAKELADPTNKKLAETGIRLWGQWSSLDSHRRNEVRHEARAMHLAHTFLRGWEYMEVEPISHLHLRTDTFDSTWTGIMERVEYHVLRHAVGDPREVKQKLAAWSDAGREYAKSAELQKPALELARRGSLIAKNVRREAFRKKREA